MVLAIREMYIQGVSTRRIKKVAKELCGEEFSASTVSRRPEKLGGELGKFARRRLEEEYAYLILDARVEKVRVDAVVRGQAVQIAIGVNTEGPRRILGVEPADSACPRSPGGDAKARSAKRACGRLVPVAGLECRHRLANRAGADLLDGRR